MNIYLAQITTPGGDEYCETIIAPSDADAIRLSRQYDIATHTPTSCPGVPSGLAWDTVKIDGLTRLFLAEPDRYVRLYRHNGYSCPEWEKSTRC